MSVFLIMCMIFGPTIVGLVVLVGLIALATKDEP